MQISIENIDLLKFPQQTLNSTATFTNKFIKHVLPKAKRFVINDTEVTGLKLRVSPNGRKRFIAVGKVRKSKKVRTKTLGDANIISLDDARIAARQFLTQLQSGIDANELDALQKIEASKKALTLNDALNNYVTDRQLKPKTVASYHYEIPKYCKLFLFKNVCNITENEICEWYLENKHRPTSIDKAFRSLRAIFEYLLSTKVISHNPCTAVTARKLRYKIKPRTRRIETYDLTKFMDAWLYLLQKGRIGTLQGDFVLWLLMTGCRLNEARTIRWSDLDIEQLAVTIIDTKNNHPHVLPLTPLMNDLLDRRKFDNPSANPYIFVAKKGKGYSDSKHLIDCRKTLDKITTTANIPQIRPHDLRRTFTTILDELDVSESNIKALLNHNDGTVTRKHYLQATNLEVKRRNLWAVGKYLERAVTVDGINQETGQLCIFSCVGSIRQFIYGTATCDFSEIKGKRTAKEILDAMR